MNKKNLMSQIVQPATCITVQDIPAELVELSEADLQLSEADLELSEADLQQVAGGLPEVKISVGIEIKF